MDCDVAQLLQVSLKRGIWFNKMHLCRAALLVNLHLSASVPLYLRIYVVVIRHYAPDAEGLVYLQKAVLSTLAVHNRLGADNKTQRSPKVYIFNSVDKFSNNGIISYFFNSFHPVM